MKREIKWNNVFYYHINKWILFNNVNKLIVYIYESIDNFSRYFFSSLSNHDLSKVTEAGIDRLKNKEEKDYYARS